VLPDTNKQEQPVANYLEYVYSRFQV